VTTNAISAVGAARTNALTPNANAANTITPNSAGAASPTAGSGELGRDAFLQLLVAQLRYQDPSKPADAASLISQSSQLAVVDKLDTISTSIDRSGTATRVDLASNLIGREVTYTGSDGYPATATVSSVRFDGTDTYVVAGDQVVPLELVLGVAAHSAASAAASTATPNSTTTGTSGTSGSTTSSTSTAGTGSSTTSNTSNAV
jgi:flagellar basal-body rod modification protein FlgD